LASAFKLRLPTTKDKSTMSVSFVVDFASLLLVGPQPTMFVAAVGALTQSTIKAAYKNPLHRTLFNTVGAAGAVYWFAGGTVGQFSWPWEATPLTAAALVYFLVNSAFIATAV